RARDQLYISYPLMVTDYNRQTLVQRPSRFVTEVPPELYEVWSLEEESALQSIPAYGEPAARAAVGEGDADEDEAAGDDGGDEGKGGGGYVN
ncbi:MAG TPA: hypothetical protein VE360_13610, partial [Pyrinomonadaceae bacterium]|nr:hypothetical protein [Pyrinomonadaceae bacterium]